MSLMLVAAINRFTGKPIFFASRPAQRLPKLPLGTQNTNGRRWSMSRAKA